jgi:hypothetical protein
MKEGSTTGLVMAAVIALVVGGVGGYAIGMNMEDKDNSSSSSVSEREPMTNTKAADLRVQLNQQMRQHVELATIALKQSAAGQPDAEAAVEALDNNSVELSETIGSVYGEDAKNDFLELWRDHIGFFVAYTNGVVSGDKAAQQEAKDNLDGYTEAASTFFSNATGADKAGLKEGLETHAAQVIAIVDAYAAEDYTKMFEAEEEAYNHIGAAADTLARAIVEQNPEKF